jgi:ribosomal protein S18 acetylase RimI-like enzyme
MHSGTLEKLFEEEIERWRQDLHWDYRPSIGLIRKFIDSRALGGFAAIEEGDATGYGFYVLEDHKGLIGGLFASARKGQAEVTKRLLANILDALRATPGIARIEAQLMPFGSELDPVFLKQYFQVFARQFMLMSLRDARPSNRPLSAGLKIEAWTDRAFDAAARLIRLAYADHVDSQINDQYRSEKGSLRFLRNIVLQPGCGQFLPEASFLLRPASGEPPIGMILTSTVDAGVGHTTQLCVAPGHQGHGIGRQLMELSIAALRRRGYESLSLTVTSVNQRAVGLYERMGFRTIKTFAAGVWTA